MMQNLMGDGMIWGVSFVWILVLLLIVLGVAALVKYLFSKN